MKRKQNYLIVEAHCGEETYTSNKIEAIKGDNKLFFEEVFNIVDFKRIKRYSKLEDFILCMVDVSKEVFEINFHSLTLTLVDGKDDTFIWGIDVNVSNSITYKLLDWRKDGNLFKYSFE